MQNNRTIVRCLFVRFHKINGKIARYNATNTVMYARQPHVLDNTKIRKMVSFTNKNGIYCEQQIRINSSIVFHFVFMCVYGCYAEENINFVILNGFIWFRTDAIYSIIRSLIIGRYGGGAKQKQTQKKNRESQRVDITLFGVFFFFFIKYDSSIRNECNKSRLHLIVTNGSSSLSFMVKSEA